MALINAYIQRNNISGYSVKNSYIHLLFSNRCNEWIY